MLSTASHKYGIPLYTVIKTVKELLIDLTYLMAIELDPYLGAIFWIITINFSLLTLLIDLKAENNQSIN